MDRTFIYYMLHNKKALIIRAIMRSYDSKYFHPNRYTKVKGYRSRLEGTVAHLVDSRIDEISYG